MIMQRIRNFIVLFLLIAAFLVCLNLINRSVGMPDFIRLELFEEMLKRMGR